MTKRIFINFLKSLCILSIFLMVSCGASDDANSNTNPDNDTNTETTLKTFENIIFDSVDFTYDGTSKSLLVEGNIPDCAKVTYTNNEQKEVGEYTVSVTIEASGYKTLTLEATLTIVALEFNDITLSDKTFTYDGTSKSLLVEGNVPEFAKVTYTNNEQKEVGEYTVSVTIEASGYKTLTLEATLTIVALEFNDITLSDKTFTYDGTSKSLLVEGNVPEFAKVTYTNNEQIEVGKYTVSVTIEASGYKTLTLEATLTIVALEFNDITLSDKTFTYDGTSKSLLVEGNIPECAKVIYTNNEQIEVGKYTVSVTIEASGYKTLTLEATLIIKEDIFSNSLDYLKMLFSIPSLDSHLPDSLKQENRLSTINNIDYSNNVLTNSINYNGVGKELNSVYFEFKTIESILNTVKPIYLLSDVIIASYKVYLATNPENPFTFIDHEGIYTYELLLTENYLTLNITFNEMSVTLYTNFIDSNVIYGGEIKVDDNNIVKYELSDDKEVYAAKLLGINYSMYDVLKESDKTTITFYTYNGTENLGLEDKALIEITDNYTSIIGTKGDFVNPVSKNNRSVEIYDTSTGKLVAYQVLEDLPVVGYYSTTWLSLDYIDNLDSIKIEAPTSIAKTSTSYINNKTDKFDTDKGLVSQIRKYDFELKDQYFYQLDSDGNMTSSKVSVPLLFISTKELLDNQFSNLNNSNDSNLNSNINYYNVNSIYLGNINKYETYFNDMNQEDIIKYLGISK